MSLLVGTDRPRDRQCQLLSCPGQLKSFENSTCVFPMFWCIGKSEATTKLENGTEALDILQVVGLCKAMQQYNGDKGNSFFVKRRQHLKHTSVMP